MTDRGHARHRRLCYCVSVDTDGGGTGVAFDQGRPPTTIAYIHGHQSHQPDAGRVAVLAPLAGGNGVAVMRSFTGGVGGSIGPASDGTTAGGGI